MAEMKMKMNKPQPPKGRTAKIHAIIAETIGLVTERCIDLGVGPSDVRQALIPALQQMEAEHQERKSRDKNKPAG